MKKAAILVLWTLFVVFLPGCKKSEPTDQPSQAKVIQLTYANFPPASTFPCVQMERWKEEVEKRTGGQVKIQTFPGGTLLEAKDMMDGVINNQADIGCLCMAYQPGRFLLTNATSLPLGIPNSKVGSQVLWDLYNKYKPDSFSEVKVLTMFATAPSNIMSKKAIRSLDDVQGVDLRASGGAAQILKAWGANQVGMPMSATPEALQKGVVQGLFSSLEVMKDFNYAELCRYVTMTDTVIYPFAVVMNQKTWDGLPDSVKQIMEELALEQCVWTGEYMDQHVRDAIEWSKDTYEVEVIELTPSQKEEWNRRLETITDEWISQAKGKGLPAEEIVTDLKTLIQTYSRQ